MGTRLYCRLTWLYLWHTYFVYPPPIADRFRHTCLHKTSILASVGGPRCYNERSSESEAPSSPLKPLFSHPPPPLQHPCASPPSPPPRRHCNTLFLLFVVTCNCKGQVPSSSHPKSNATTNTKGNVYREYYAMRCISPERETSGISMILKSGTNKVLPIPI